jgi:hypothetical protein
MLAKWIPRRGVGRTARIPLLVIGEPGYLDMPASAYFLTVFFETDRPPPFAEESIYA